MTLALRPLDLHEYPQWDALVRGHPAGAIYHETSWLVPVCKAVQQRLVIYGVFEGKQLVGGVPLEVRRKGPITIARRAYATPYAGLLVEPELRIDAHVWRHIHRLLRACHSHTCLTTSPFSAVTVPPPRWRGRTKATYLLDIPCIETTWESLKYQARKKIRRAKKEGLTAERLTDLSHFFPVFAKTFERRGMVLPFAAQRLSCMLEAIENSGGGASYAVRTPKGAACAVGLVLYDARRAYYAFAGTDAENAPPQASALLLWHILEETAKRTGLIDLVGANIPSINRFKKQFGGTPTPYFEYHTYRTPVERGAIGAWDVWRKKTRRA